MFFLKEHISPALQNFFFSFGREKKDNLRLTVAISPEAYDFISSAERKLSHFLNNIEIIPRGRFSFFGRAPRARDNSSANQKDKVKFYPVARCGRFFACSREKLVLLLRKCDDFHCCKHYYGIFECRFFYAENLGRVLDSPTGGLEQ